MQPDELEVVARRMALYIRTLLDQRDTYLEVPYKGITCTAYITYLSAALGVALIHFLTMFSWADHHRANARKGRCK